MFTGRPHRSVNLGSRKPPSANDALRNAQIQREKRERQRREVNAATVIQNAWRGLRDSENARHELTVEVSKDPHRWLGQPGIYAYISPDLPNWSSEIQRDWTVEFSNSPESAKPSTLSLQRSPLLLELPEVAGNSDSHALFSLKVLSRQAPPNISLDVMIPLIRSILKSQSAQDKSSDSSEHSISEGYKWLSEHYPATVFASLMKQPERQQIIRDMSQEALVPFYKVSFSFKESSDKGSELITDVDTLVVLMKKLLPESNRSWPLLFQIVDSSCSSKATTNSAFSSVVTQNIDELYSRSIVEQAIISCPLELAKYTQNLSRIAPTSKTRIWVKMAMAQPSPAPNDNKNGNTDLRPVKIFWQMYKESHSELALSLSVESIFYWSLVVTDYELWTESQGLHASDLREIAEVVKQQCFNILWRNPQEGNGRESVATSSEAVMSRLQWLIYHRDSRMNLFEPGFWTFDRTFDQKVAQSFDSYLRGSLLKANRIKTALLASSSAFNGNNGRVNATSASARTDGEEAEEDINDEVSTGDGKHIELDANPAKRVSDYAPFFVTFETRVKLFSQCVSQDRERYDIQGLRVFGRQHFDINRETMVEDAQHVFASSGKNVKTELAVRLSSNGHAEAGIDGGGLTRESLIALCDKLFHEEPTTASTPSFVETPQHTLLPNPKFGEYPELMNDRETRLKFLFMGQVIGKCLYENVLINVKFSPLFISKWKGGNASRSTFDDLALLDPELYRSLTRSHSIHGEDVANLGLDFTVVTSQGETSPFVPNGDQIAVTDANKLEYMEKLANFMVNKTLHAQSMWFVMGLHQVISVEWLDSFNPHESNKLISGESSGMDVDDLKKHATIMGFAPDSPTIANSWEVLKEFNEEDQAQFSKFVISVPNAPLLGFSRLDPGFGIRYVGHDDERSPTASTCVNLLKSPEYSSKETLRRKLSYSIRAKAGFELS